MKNTIAEKKNTLERINDRLDEEEDCISDLEDKVQKAFIWNRKKIIKKIR